MRTRTIRSCDVCGNTYSKREHYERHVRVHTREKPFACVQCPATFSRRDTLRRHLRSLHPGSQERSTTHGAEACLADEHRALPSQACAKHSASNADTSSCNASLGLAPISTSPGVMLQSDFESFDWQWDSALNLDPSFSVAGLGIDEPEHLIRSRTPRPLTPSSGPESQANPPQPTYCPGQALNPENHRAPRLPPDVREASQSEVDQASRDVLAQSLRQRVPDTTLPSTGFLNRCIYKYTTQLWPLVPVVHLPTFKPVRTNPLLLLNICALGALADGSASAYHHAVRLFESVRKALLVSFSIETQDNVQALSVMQAAVIGQSCVLLAGQATNLRIARLFHGTVAVLMQEYYNMTMTSCNSTSLEPGTSDQSSGIASDWQRWIDEQTLLRLCAAVHIHNSEIAAIVNQPAQFRTQKYPHAAEPDNLYLTKTAEEWRLLSTPLASTNERPMAMLSSCAELAHIAAEISHSKLACPDDGQVKDASYLRSSLIGWLERQKVMPFSERKHRLSPMLLWHSCFLQIACDFELLQRSCMPTRHDHATSQRYTSPTLSSSSLEDWMCSKNSRTAILHAMLIFKSLEDFRVSEVPAIHVARCGWHAGLVLTVYSRFTASQGDAMAGWPDDLQDHPELLLARQVACVTETDWNTIRQPLSAAQSRTLAYALCTILRHLGPWGNAAWFSDKLAQALEILDS